MQYRIKAVWRLWVFGREHLVNLLVISKTRKIPEPLIIDFVEA